MPGLYSHTARNTGDTLTSSIYNQGHQNHIDNLEPDTIDDYSANVTAMQATTDPGEVSSESLATSLAGELERLRFVIKEMKGTAQWYTTVTTKTAIGSVHGNFGDSANANVAWVNAVTTTVIFSLPVPLDWSAGTNMTFHLFRRKNVADANQADFTYSLVRVRDATTTNLWSSGTMHMSDNDLQSHDDTLSLDAANFQAGDIIRVVIARDGAGDAYGNPVHLDGHYFTYTAVACR